MTTQFFRDPALPFLIESRRACDSRVCYQAHSHDDYSIGAVDAGCSVFNAKSCQDYQLNVGDLVFIPTNQRHSCNPVAEYSWSYQMLHIQPHWIQQLEQELQALSFPDQGLQYNFQHIYVMHDQALYEQFCQMNQCLFSSASNFEKELAFTDFIQTFLTRTQSSQLTLNTEDYLQHPQLYPYLSELNQNRLLSLEQLAQMTHLSRYQIIRLFKAHTGFTPHYFQLNLRINCARQYLQQHQSISDVAYQLGFADQSHFQRTFKLFTGITPQQYMMQYTS
ncbi:AraC family transcriptional regulator [Acinetobacter puyangensis]|uniref:AraC family transcriptional regulator n=1 Tax=Acinetobacter puyangensis TaxID=1096779 RepID=UPI003A4D6598